jgi:hypothetical protein
MLPQTVDRGQSLSTMQPYKSVRHTTLQSVRNTALQKTTRHKHTHTHTHTHKHTRTHNLCPKPAPSAHMDRICPPYMGQNLFCPPYSPTITCKICPKPAPLPTSPPTNSTPLKPAINVYIRMDTSTQKKTHECVHPSLPRRPLFPLPLTSTSSVRPHFLLQTANATCQ